MTNKLGVAIIGCGNIADKYAENLSNYPQIKLVGAADLEVQRAEALAAKYSCRAYPSVAALLADRAVELVVNLTVHHAHYAVNRRCLMAGKHVHSEKPLALTEEEAWELVDLAGQKGLRLGCSPFTIMGEGQQTAWKVIREGRLGRVRVAYAEVNWGRIEQWHPAPAPFYEVGALFDVGVYPLTLLTAIFGPARRVWAYGTILQLNRATWEGVPFQLKTPDFVVATVELLNGTVVRLTTNFYVGHHSKQSGIEFHGDLGSLYLSSWHNFDGTVEFAEYGQPYAPVPLLKEAYQGSSKVEWGRAVLDMAKAIVAKRPHRATGEHAAHVVDILRAITRSMERNEPVQIRSDFMPPAPMEWGR